MTKHQRHPARGDGARVTCVAVPTVYEGVNFRSRLEARWAAMFDLLGWEWEYEPVELAGYIPDFRLPGVVMPERAWCRAGIAVEQCLIEIKPIVDPACFSSAIDKAVQALLPGDRQLTRFIFLGDRPWLSNGAMGVCCDIVHLPLKAQHRHLAPSPHAVHLTPSGKLVSNEAAWRANDKDICVRRCVVDCDACSEDRKARLTALWREAGNRTQWRAVTTQDRRAR